MVHVGLNAHLLSHENSYRAAGIHTVIHQTLAHLPTVAPPDWRFTAMVNRAVEASYAGITMQPAAWRTDRAVSRVVWEQSVQPVHLPKFDLYHTLAFVGPLVQLAPMVVTVYDLTFMRYPQRLTTARRLYLRTMTELTCRRARRILAISHSTAHDLSELLNVDPAKVDVTPLGYDTARYRPLPPEDVAAFRQANALPERFWLFLGTLEPRKNLVTLVHAYAALPKSDRLPLILAGGKGWKTDDLFSAIADHQLTDDIILPGFVDLSEIALWYNAAEAFVYPSVFEGFGLPVLEAMACGTPVITSNVSSLPEVAEGAGLCLPPHDTDAWVAGLQTIYHDDAWREQARTRGLHKAQQFRWQTTAQLTINSYQKALS